MFRRKQVVVLCVLAILIGSGIAAWKIPFAGQWRVERPVADLLPSEPGLAGQWRIAYEGPMGTDTTWGIEEYRSRSYRLDEHNGVSETVRRFSSPTWAALAMPTYDWRIRELHEPERVEYRAHGLRTQADSARFICGRVGRICDMWLVRLRYGQYHVRIEAGQSSADSVPSWLHDIVHNTDHTMVTRAPRSP